jgi:hypothetical protein
MTRPLVVERWLVGGSVYTSKTAAFDAIYKVVRAGMDVWTTYKHEVFDPECPMCDRQHWLNEEPVCDCQVCRTVRNAAGNHAMKADHGG